MIGDFRDGLSGAGRFLLARWDGLTSAGRARCRSIPEHLTSKGRCVHLRVVHETAARASECQVLEPGANLDNARDSRTGSAFGGSADAQAERLMQRVLTAARR